MSASATRHFIAQRGSAMALVVLTLWFVIAMSRLPSWEHEVVFGFLATPLNSVLLLLLCVVMAYHSYLGVQVIIEDYVHSPKLNWASLLLSKAAHLAVGLLLAYTAFDIGFGA